MTTGVETMATLIGDVYGADPSPFHGRAPAAVPATARHTPPHSTQSGRPASPPLSSSNSFSSPPIKTQHSQPPHPTHNSTLQHSSAPRRSQSLTTTSDKGQSAQPSTARILTPPESSPCAQQSQPLPSHAQEPQTTAQSLPRSGTTARDVPVPNRKSTMTSVPAPPPPVPAIANARTIMIRDLAHIQTLTQPDHDPDAMVHSTHGLLAGDAPTQDVKFDISAMPIGDIIEMVAALLTKITTTNDQQHDAIHRNATNSRQAHAHDDGQSSSRSSPYSASVLAFHGKNVPAITILSYLSRIHKYCPTTYEVFLSLLVYFDRMTERVNDMVIKQQEERRTAARAGTKTGSLSRAGQPLVAPSEDVSMDDAHGDGSIMVTDDADDTIADSGDSSSESSDEASTVHRTSVPAHMGPATRTSSPASVTMSASTSAAATYFVVDSYNIHRLVIAGVTCASKFFSDVFYTNARYAKVGGLPLAELNHLELQFLILNDFRLAIPIEDLDAYATMLVEFYAREVVGPRPRV